MLRNHQLYNHHHVVTVLCYITTTMLLYNHHHVARFMFCGRLVGHNGAVCALSLSNGIMATGARDRLIKLFDLSSLDLSTPSPVSLPSMCTLYPPHYDAVSAFGVHGNLLFSACGVTIKQWDLSERSLKQVQ